MKISELYKIFNRKEKGKEKVLYLIIFLSIMISVSVSLIIPCMKYQTNEFCKENAEVLNGGKLKVETSYEDEEWENYLDSWDKDQYVINKFKAFSVTMENRGNYIYCSMISGNYNINADEIILSKGLADEKKAKVGDTVRLEGKDYVVKEIEENAEGVDGQSELIGYCKTVQDVDIVAPYTYVYTIDSENVQEIVEKLNKDFNRLSYSTAADKEQELRENLNLNIVSLNVLNTMSFVFTLLSIGSSLVMIIIRRQRDIAILKVLSIRNKVIQYAFLREIEEILIGAIILSAVIGPLAANFVLKANGFPGLSCNMQVVKIIGYGTLLNMFLYSVFSYIIISVVKKMNPVDILKNNSESILREKKRVVIKAMLFLVLAFVLYAIYLNNVAVLFSSMLLVFFILFMCLIILVLISVWDRLPARKSINKYFKKSIRSAKGTFVISIVSFAMTVWFLFMGYTFVVTVYDSYEQSSGQELEYNYMVFGDDASRLESVLKDMDTIEYTKLQKEAAFLVQKDGTYQAASLCFVPTENYEVQLYMKEGEAIGEGSKEAVLVSDDMAAENELSIGDILYIQTENETRTAKIKGIYEAGGINKNYILTEKEVSHIQMELFLVKALQENFEQVLEDVTIVKVSTLAMSIMNVFKRYLNMFQNLVFISIFNSILFNCIIVCINSKIQEKNYTIMHAIGISKKELYKIELKKYGLTVIFSFGMAAVLYLLISKLCLQVLFKIDMYMSAVSFLEPMLVTFVLVGIIYAIPICRIKKDTDYEILRVE